MWNAIPSCYYKIPHFLLHFMFLSKFQLVFQYMNEHFLYCSLSAASEESMSNSSNCEQRINKFPFVDQQLKYLP